MASNKVYMIVTNDEYETPVYTDVVGAEKVAEILGMKKQAVRRNLCYDKWSHLSKFKAVVDETGSYELAKKTYIRNYWRNRGVLPPKEKMDMFERKWEIKNA